MNWEQMQAAIRAADEAYKAGDDATKQAAVANRNAAVAAFESYKKDTFIQQTLNPSPAPTPAAAQRPAYTPPPPPPTPPDPWMRTPTFTAPTGIKQADPDIVLAPTIDTSGDFIAERFFEELGGTELINLSRHDLIDGIKVEYNPIANLSSLRKRFNPNNIISIDYLSLSEFARTSIDLLARGPQEPYFDDNGDLVIEVDIIRSEENIEAEISESGTVSRIEL